MDRCPDHFLSRRNLLTIGAIGGLTLTDFFRLRSAPGDQKDYETKEGTAQSVIFIFLPGGMAQQESFDPKPNAPIEYRGPFSSIATKVPDLRMGSLFSRTARIADKVTVIRSMTHGEAAHQRGVHNMFTGYRPSPALQYPSIGSVVAHEFGPRNNLPPYVLVPNQPNPYAGTGYLSSSFAGFSIGDNPERDGFRVRDLALPGGVEAQQFERRRRMLDVVNDHFRQREKSDAMDAVDSFYNRAYSLISSPEAREAFDLEKEDDAMRDSYGRNAAGARMLLSRRLVEAGVRFVTMTYGGWDHHDQIESGFNNQVPPLDQALARLITDLDERGLLDSTLVCLCSEFGRTPKINRNAGRDHWPKVYSLLMAGGGVQRGLAYGTSDSTASEPDRNPVTVQDWATTLYQCMGIAADKELMAPGNRPIEIVDGGNVITDILA